MCSDRVDLSRPIKLNFTFDVKSHAIIRNQSFVPPKAPPRPEPTDRLMTLRRTEESNVHIIVDPSLAEMDIAHAIVTVIWRRLSPDEISLQSIETHTIDAGAGSGTGQESTHADGRQGNHISLKTLETCWLGVA